MSSEIATQIIDYDDKRRTHIETSAAAVKARARLDEAGIALGKALYEEVKYQIGGTMQHNQRTVLIRDVRPHHSDKSVIIPMISEMRADGETWGKRMQPLNYTGWDRSRKMWAKMQLNGQTGRQIFVDTGKPQE